MSQILAEDISLGDGRSMEHNKVRIKGNESMDITRKQLQKSRTQPQTFNAQVRRGRAWISDICPEILTCQVPGVRLTKKMREDIRATIRWISENLDAESLGAEVK